VRSWRMRLGGLPAWRKPRRPLVKPGERDQSFRQDRAGGGHA
jgi:hypothetical protein